MSICAVALPISYLATHHRAAASVSHLVKTTPYTGWVCGLAATSMNSVNGLHARQVHTHGEALAACMLFCCGYLAPLHRLLFMIKCSPYPQ